MTGCTTILTYFAQSARSACAQASAGPTRVTTHDRGCCTCWSASGATEGTFLLEAGSRVVARGWASGVFVVCPGRVDSEAWMAHTLLGSHGLCVARQDLRPGSGGAQQECQTMCTRRVVAVTALGWRAQRGPHGRVRGVSFRARAASGQRAPGAFGRAGADGGRQPTDDRLAKSHRDGACVVTCGVASVGPFVRLRRHPSMHAVRRAPSTATRPTCWQGERWSDGRCEGTLG